MNKTKIYGLLNEDREIIFISDWQPVDWDPDYWIDEDIDWKIIILDDKRTFDDVDTVDWDKNIVILEQVDTDEEKIKEALDRWIKTIKPKYVLDYISPVDLMTLKMRKEREWEEEDRKWLDMENMDSIDCNM